LSCIFSSLLGVRGWQFEPCSAPIPLVRVPRRTPNFAAKPTNAIEPFNFSQFASGRPKARPAYSLSDRV
jgi:hypothetical protein